ncbi:MAG: MFS transporter [Clostridia bacterium]|nr:MFS transporter [Clostridia bacterium]
MKLNYKKVVLVGFAFLLIQAFWIAYDAIVPMMLVNKFGMNQTWSGLIMALDNILALFMLPLFGSLSDKCGSKMGKRKPFVLIGTLCAVVAFFGLSFADYAQYKNLGAKAQMPENYSATVASAQTQEFFWEENAEIINNEYTRSSSKNNNALGEKVRLRDYAASFIYGKERFSDLTAAQQEACRQWYSEIDLTESYVFSVEDGKPVYRIYKYKDKDEPYRIEYGEDGSFTETAVSVKEAKSVGVANVYSILVSTARSDYAAKITYKNPMTLIIFMVMLLITLVAMSVFRSPAVALMPDVVVKPLRSKGNAIINLMGVVGGIIILALGAVVGTDKVQNQLMPYMAYIGGVCVLMLVSLAVFMFRVKEPKWNAEMLEEQAAIDAKEAALLASRTITDAAGENALPAENAEKTAKLSKGQLTSLIFILLSVAFWYMGYNAVYSKYSVYSVNVLGKEYNLVLIAAQLVAFAAFLPIGILSGKLGRKKMILIGVAILFASFLGSCFMKRSSPDWLPYVLFSLVGIGWAAINVNSFPMVVELAKGSDIGKYTGYYYTASMAAQIVTPLFSGIIMDAAGSMTPLFWYGTVFVALSFVTMLFVRHGDSIPERKKSALEYLDAGDD